RTAASTRGPSYPGRAAGSPFSLVTSQRGRAAPVRVPVRGGPLGGRQDGRDVGDRAAVAGQPDGPLEALHDRGEDLGERLLVECLALEERHDQRVEDAAVLDQDLPGLVVRV